MDNTTQIKHPDVKCSFHSPSLRVFEQERILFPAFSCQLPWHRYLWLQDSYDQASFEEPKYPWLSHNIPWQRRISSYEVKALLLCRELMHWRIFLPILQWHAQTVDSPD